MLSRIYPILLLIVLSGLCILLCPASGSALVAYWGSHPNKERLVLQFSDSIPQYTLARTDKENLTLTFSGWETSEDAPLDSLDFSDAVLFSSVRKGVKNLQIQTRTDAFGYLHFVLADQQKIVVDLFPDRMGEKWRKPRPELPEGARNSPGKQKSHESGDQPPKGQAELEKADSEPGLSKIQESDPGTPESDAEGVPEDFIEGIIKEQSPPSEEERKTSAVPASPKNQLRAPALKVGPDRAPILRASNRGSVKIKPKPPADPEIHEQEAKSGKGASEDKSPILDSPPSEPSPEIKKLLSAAKNAEAMGHLNEASILLRRILEKDDLDEKVREFCLFELAEVTFREHHREMKPFFKEVVTALEHALNSFPESHRVPHALLLLGQTHLLAGNEPEAEAYFNILRNRYPEHPDIPQTFLFWGDHLLQTGRFTKAADAYQHVLDEYPESDTAKEAAVGLSKALWKSGFYDQAFDVIEFIKKRWSGYYLENPDILQVEGIVAIHLDEFDRALTSLWAKYNLTPEAADSDLVLARLGDAYLLDGKRETAREIYERTILQYPGKEGGLIAKMRLAEEGIFDEPDLEQMPSILQTGTNYKPEEVYKEISQEHPDSPLAAVAQLKLAMWYLHQQEYEKTLDSVLEFRARFPMSDFLPKAEEVGRKAFAAWVPTLIEREQFSKLQDVWEEHDYLNESFEEFDAQSRLGLALSYWRTGKVEQAVALAKPVLDHPRFSNQEKNMAFELLLALFTEREQWREILNFADNLDRDFLSPQPRSQLTYAVALAHQKLGEPEKSIPLWEQVAVDANIDPVQQAFAFTFLARNSFDSKEYKQTHGYAQQALSRFLKEGENKAKIKECLDLLVLVSERTGRTQQALKWANEYENWITPEEPEWPSFHYRVANLYRTGGDAKTWRRMLEEIMRVRPDSLYARMAETDLSGYDLDQRRDAFR